VVKIQVDLDEIIQIGSPEGEEFKIKRVKCVNIPVEKWLSSLLDSIMLLVKRSTKDAKAAYKADADDFKRHEWVMQDFPAQSISLVGSI